MLVVDQCLISKSWTLQEECGSYETRMNVIKRMQDLKPTFVEGNMLLAEILKHVDNMYKDERYPNPFIQMGGKTYVISRANFHDYPRSCKLFQYNVAHDGQKWQRTHSRMVKILFKQ